MRDRGKKWTCKGCGASFYDLGKKSPSCPKCGLEVVVKNAKSKPRTAKPTAPENHEADENNSNIWIVSLSDKDAKPAVISGPASLDLSGIKKTGWYFFDADREQAGSVLSADTAVRLADPPTLGMRRFLGSRHFRGIGPETARKIVDLDEANPFSAMSRNADQIAKKIGLTRKIASDFLDSWKKNSDICNLQILLRELEFGAMAISAISNEFGAQIIRKMLADPYRLVRELPRFMFEDAERLIRKINLELTDDYRMASAAEHILFDRAKGWGHTSAPLNRVAREVSRLMQDFSEPEIEACIIEATDKFVVRDIGKQKHVATMEAEEKDQTIAETLFRMVRDQSSEEYQDQDVAFGQNLDIDYPLSEEQERALDLAVRSPVALITGGPGTGKSTMVEAIVKALTASNHSIHLCAPTGRAAKRLAENDYLRDAIGPTTIHMFLARRRGESKTPVDVLIIDEASMIDINLMLRVCDALEGDSRLILIGDADQLPPIDPGQVFKDLLSSNVLPVARLTGNYRQDSQSAISTVAKQVTTGKMPNLDITSAESDFEFIDEKDEDRTQDLVLSLYSERLPAKHNYVPERDIQILSPMKQRGPLGTEPINQRIQNERWSANKPIVSIKNRPPLYRGDKVLQTKNVYRPIDVRNGDIGIIDQRDNEIIVSFDYGEVVYPEPELKNLEPAYAVSVHKSQGSEYPAVIIPVARSHAFMLGRNLLYTAITRGKKKVVMVGDRDAFEDGINAWRKGLRYTMLQQVLKEKAAE